MEDISTLASLMKVAPLVILVLIAVFVVFRGLRKDGDSTNNRAKGGGPDWPGSHY